jgi:glycosyltransferase involved in cell wall biosynthesis
MAEILKDEKRRAAMRETGIKRAAQFSWDRAAQATHDVYKALMSVPVA